MQQSAKRKGMIDWRGWCIVGVIAGAIAAVLLPKYAGQFEKLRALSMQAMLVNVVIAQAQYHQAYGKYTDQWSELLPYVAQPETLEPELEQVAGEPYTYFFGFGKNAARKQRGYRVSLQIDADQNGGMITAVRTPNWFYSYTLTSPFPQENTNCRSSKMSRRFCEQFLANVAELDLKNLVPVSNDKTVKEN